MTAPLLRVDHLSVTHFDATSPRPDDVSFTVHAGEAVLVLGPSGCGKSTLARALNGLIPQSLPAEVTGSVHLADAEGHWHDVADLGVARASQHVAMVFQDADAQIVTGQVFDEVAFGPENLRLPVAEVERRAADALERLGLLARRGDAPEVLSGGGRQRLAIASALAMGSPLLVLDEPTANLDPAATRGIYAALGELVRAGSHGLLLIEHDLDEALTIATRVLVLDARGRLVLDGTPAEIFRGHAPQLRELGVWLPVAYEAAERFTAAGWPIGDPPLLGFELAARLEAVDGRGGAVAGPQPHASDHVRTPRLEARELTVLRGRTQVLGPVSVQVPPGAVTAIVGHNGAGKSSLLQALAGVRHPPRGSVLLDGADVGRMRAAALRARLGYVFQNPEHQFLTHSVRGELAFELGRDVADADARVDRMLARFGLAEHADRHPFLLSGGQKRRLTVAAALLDGADVLVLDEPTFGQDRARAEELVALLRELHAEGATLVLATHDLQLVTELATHVVVLDRGLVAESGTVHDVIASGAFERAGLGLPPLARALDAVERHPWLRGISSLEELDEALG